MLYVPLLVILAALHLNLVGAGLLMLLIGVGILLKHLVTLKGILTVIGVLGYVVLVNNPAVIHFITGLVGG